MINFFIRESGALRHHRSVLLESTRLKSFTLFDRRCRRPFTPKSRQKIDLASFVEVQWDNLLPTV